MRSDMPIPLTLPLHFDLRLRSRRRRLRRVVIAALALLGAAVAVGFWLPARAELTLAGAPGVGDTAGHCNAPLRALRDVAIGDELMLEQADGAVLAYEVIALDVVDSARVEFPRDPDERHIALVTCWPLDTTTVGGHWQYVVTVRVRR